MALAPERTRLVALMSATAHSQEAKGNWTYLAVRPQNVKYTATQLVNDHIYADCSDGCRALSYAAGIKDDPAGGDYQPWGNSSSIFMHLRHIPMSEVQPGDVFTFGFYAGEHHAAMAYAKDEKGAWTVWNHGAPGQPVLGSLADEIAGHAGMTVTACRQNITDPPPSPQDELRAETGWWAWVAWRLGEGPWKTYGKANPSVRPNVPKVIPLSWWKQLAAFLLARKKPTT